MDLHNELYEDIKHQLLDKLSKNRDSYSLVDYGYSDRISFSVLNDSSTISGSNRSLCIYGIQNAGC